MKTPIPPGHFAKHRLTLKENEAEARERLRAFWAGGSLGCPAVLATVKGQPLPPAPWERQFDHLTRFERDWSPEVGLSARTGG